MGVSNKIQDTNLDITQFTCFNCQQSFTNQDKLTNNWEVWWDTSNDIEVKEVGSWWQITAYARNFTHQDHQCAETERCRNCYHRFLKKKMTELNGDYYCPPCHQQISHQEF